MALPRFDVVRQPVPSGLASAPPQIGNRKLIDAPGLVYEQGHLIAAYLNLNDYADALDVPAVRDAVLRVRCPRERASGKGGMEADRSFFGWTPAVGFKGWQVPRPAGMNKRDPDAQLTLDEAADGLASIYRQIDAARYQRHADLAEQRLAGYRMAQSPWSSGVVNGSLLGFHRDGQNVPQTWSAMLTFRTGNLSGGELVLPELGIAFACQDGTVAFFEGGTFWHGVTATFGPGTRRSAVWYTRNGRW